MPEQSGYRISGGTASQIATDLEAAVRSGRLRPGDRLPTVRAVAADVGVSPATVASAYRDLRRRGLVAGQGRRGTTVSRRPPVAAPARPAPRSDVRDLASGNPDPALLPKLGPALRRVASERPLLGGGDPVDPALARLAAARLQDDGIPADHLAVVSGALDGIERVLGAHTRPGDRVVVEDPGFLRVLDLLPALGLVPEPVGIDDSGMLPGELDRALDSGAVAAVLTPRAQNPRGSALDASRAAELRAVLDRHPDTVLIEDDHAGAAAGTSVVTLASASRHWAVVRSVSKTLGPDLRLAVLAGDEVTVGRVQGRQMLGPGHVSFVLQELVVGLWSDPAVERRVQLAAERYAERRGALLEALAEHGIEVYGRSGLNVWVPVREESATVQSLERDGWAVAPGEAFRLASGPAIRVTAATLKASEAGEFARRLAPLA